MQVYFNLDYFHHSQVVFLLCRFAVNSHSYLQFQAITDLLSLTGLLFHKNFIQVDSYGIQSCECDFFHSVYFSGSFMQRHISIFCSFYLLSNILLHEYTTFYLSFHQLINIWIVFNFWLFCIMLLKKVHIHKSLCG